MSSAKKEIFLIILRNKIAQGKSFSSSTHRLPCRYILRSSQYMYNASFQVSDDLIIDIERIYVPTEKNVLATSSAHPI